MKLFRLIAILAMLHAAGCGAPTASQLARVAAPDEAAAAALKVYDLDGNGAIGRDELKASPALSAGAAKIDLNRDGSLSADELLTRFQALAAGPSAMGLEVQVSFKKRPLPNAKVTLVPEPFMGEGLQSYSGVTESAGHFEPKGDEMTMPGLPVGYYTAHIVEPQMAIDQSIGCEIAQDTSGNRLDLQL